MLKKISVLLIIATTWGCSSYHITNIKENSSSISSIKNSTILIRTSQNGRITSSEIEKNLTVWLNGYTQRKKLFVAKPNDNSLQSVANRNDSFYQISDNGKFLKYKSIGVVRLFVANNSDKLKSIMNKSKSDSLIIYEIDSGFSAAMQYVEFNSVVVIINKNLEILYIDNQKDAFDSIENEESILKNSLMDKISDRFLEILSDYDFIESND